MDTFLAIASKREVRSYAPDPVPEDVVQRVLETGRVSGSSRNVQRWRFVVLEAETRARAADMIYAPDNLRQATLAIAIVVGRYGQASFDSGRAAQNMMLAAWNDGVGSCPNGVADAAALGELLGLGEEEQVAILLTFGYPRRPVDPQARSAQEWIQRANRKPPEEVISRV